MREIERNGERERERETRGGAQRERPSIHPSTVSFAMLSFVGRVPSKDGSRTAGELLFACGLGCRTPRLPRGLASGRNARRENPQHHGRLGPALQDLLVSRRAVCASHGRLVERERASPSLSSHPLFASNFLPPPPFARLTFCFSATVWSLPAIAHG